MPSTQPRAGRSDEVRRPSGRKRTRHDDEIGGIVVSAAKDPAADLPAWWDECLRALDFYGGPLDCVWEPPRPVLAAGDDEVDEDEEDMEDDEELDDEDEEDEDELDDEEDADEDEELEDEEDDELEDEDEEES